MLPPNRVSTLAGLRAISFQYELGNIWNMDESGLFFRMGSNRSYLSAFESRSQVCGTEFGKYKDRATLMDHTIRQSHMLDRQKIYCITGHTVAV